MRDSVFCVCLTALAPAVYAAPAVQQLPAEVTDAFSCYTALPSQLVPVLQQAQDKDSADAAAPVLHQTLTHIYTAREKLHRMPALTPAQNEQVRTQFGQQMRQEWARLYEEILRLRAANCHKSVALAKEFRLMCMMIEK